MNLKVAIVQAEVSATLREGLAHSRALAHEAATAGAQLIVFPETWLPGYPAWLDTCRDVGIWDSPAVKTVFGRHAAESVDVAGDAGSELSRLAADTGATIVIGVVERVAQGPGNGTLYNSMLTYGPDGRLLNHHRKLMPTYTERLVWGQGDADGLHAVASSGARIGGLICWEHWMPLARQALHESGEDVHCALWPSVHEMHVVASRQYAFEGRCYVLAAGSLMRARNLPAELEAHPGKIRAPDQWVLRGGSAIIAPTGHFIAEPVYDAPTILHAELDLDAVRREHMNLDVAGHYGRRDTFDFTVRTSGRPTERPV
jgi:predicted amidohydrolase